MLVYVVFAAGVGLAVGVTIGLGPGLVAGLMVAGAGYAARQVIRDD